MTRNSTSGLLAAGLMMMSVPSIGHAQFYVSGQVGYARADFTLAEPYNGVIDDNAVAYGLNLGYGIREYISIEGAWHGYGNFDGRAAPCPPDGPCPPPTEQVPTSGNNISMLTLAAVPRLVLGEIAELYGNVGYYRANVDANIPAFDAAFRRRGLLIGGGVRWEFAEPWNVNFEMKRFGDRMHQFTVGFGWQQEPFRRRHN